MIDQARDELARDPIIWWNLAAASLGALRADPGGEPGRRRRARRARSAHAAGAPVSEPCSRCRDLADLVSRRARAGRAAAVVDGVDLAVARGEVAGAGRRVGLRQVDDGALDRCGSCRSPGRVDAGSVRLDGRDLLALAGHRDAPRARRARSAMIFQEPMTSLNPVMTVGAQVVEAIQLHERVSRGAGARAARSSSSSRSASPIPTRASTPIRISSPAA